MTAVPYSAADQVGALNVSSGSQADNQKNFDWKSVGTGQSTTQSTMRRPKRCKCDDGVTDGG